MTMTSRERVLTALDHRQPDRPPLNYFGTPETTEKLLQHLKLETFEDLKQFFGADMRYVSASYVGPTCYCGMSGYAGGGTDVWGQRWEPVRNEFCTYYEVLDPVLKSARNVQDLEGHSWPNPDWFDVSGLKEAIKAINDPEPRAIVYPMGSFLETARAMRGFEIFTMDMIERPEMVEFMLEKTVGFFEELAMRAVEAADGGIDIVWSASDVGMQTGMMFSPGLWRELVKPFHRRLITPFKEMGLKTRYHTDGSVEPIIEDLIEMGLDILDPIQPDTPGMDPQNLRETFGGRLSFYGGVDTQKLLPFGSPKQVEQKVLELIRVLGDQGGYIVAASNAVQADVPVANILALYCTARDYTYYTC